MIINHFYFFIWTLFDNSLVPDNFEIVYHIYHCRSTGSYLCDMIKNRRSRNCMFVVLIFVEKRYTLNWEKCQFSTVSYISVWHVVQSQIFNLILTKFKLSSTICERYKLYKMTYGYEEWLNCSVILKLDNHELFEECQVQIELTMFFFLQI